MTAAEPPPRRFSTATDPLSSPYTATDTSPEAPFSNSQIFPSIQTTRSEFNEDLIATNERPSKCKRQFQHVPPQPNTPCPSTSIADDLSTIKAEFQADLKKCFNNIIDVLRDEPSPTHDLQGFNRHHCHKQPKSDPCTCSTFHVLPPPAPETCLLPMKPPHHNLICDDMPPSKPPHALPLVHMLLSDMRPASQISHSPITAKYVSTTPTIYPTTLPHAVMPAMAPNIRNTGASMMKPDTIPAKSTPQLQSLLSLPFSMPLPCPAVFFIQSTERFYVNSVCMNGTLLSNRKKFHGKYPHHYQDDGQHLHQHLPSQKAVVTC